MDRRQTLKLLALAPLPVAIGDYTLTTNEVLLAHEKAQAARLAGSAELQFFTEHEYETAKVLSDLILPADDRSGSASDLGVPEFIDFMMVDRPYLQVPIRGGLAWLDNHTRLRFSKSFLEADDTERRSILDEIAYPDDFEPGVEHGVAFFSRFRDLTASGFWTTREGIEDLQYLGNTAIAEWEGAPQAEMERLGLSFDAWEVL